MSEPKEPKPTYHWQSAREAWGEGCNEPPTELAKAVQHLADAKKRAKRGER